MKEQNQKILIILGTRPEAIKLAPLIKALRSENCFEVGVCITAQHRHLLDKVLSFFDIKPDFDLNIMKKGQDLTNVTCQVLTGLKPILQTSSPDWVFIHGDTTTTFASAIASFYAGLRIAHVEAGLRTGNIMAPWPEEFNRKSIAPITTLHFAPTAIAKNNLINEGVNPRNIVVTGNTVIDALLEVDSRIKFDNGLRQELFSLFPFLDASRKLILITAHRRENFGKNFEDICSALSRISKRNDVQIVFPIHPNPNITEPARRVLGKEENIHLLDPQDYLPFVYLMSRSYLILTDSGGVQEEAPSLGKPVLVMRETTERPEAIEAGTVKLIGTNSEIIYRNIVTLLDNSSIYQKMSSAHNPYGDGKACMRIIHSITQFKG